MAQSTPSPSQPDNRSTAANVAPPDERFWQHYSPHGEFPLSSISSFVVHLLLFGLVALVAWVGVVLFNHSNRSLPVEAVQLDIGGGNPGGPRGNPGADGDPKEDIPQPIEPTKKTPSQTVRPPKIPDSPLKKPEFDDPSKRPIQTPDSDNSSSINRLRDMAAKIQFPGSAPSGREKDGTGPGSDGEGTSAGSKKGPGGGTLTPQQQRMLRWTMLFNVNNSRDYVAQLNGLDAILAIPVRGQGNDAEYEIIRNLSARPAKPRKEKIKDIQRMVYWMDDKPDSVQGVMSVLGLSLRPNHFLAFMPEALEKKLLDLEIAYLHKRHPNRKEGDIASTIFEIRASAGKYEPVVIDQKLKK